MDSVLIGFRLIVFSVIVFEIIDYFLKRNQRVLKREPVAISNERRKDLDLLGRYYDVLKIHHSTSIYPRLVEELYTSRLTELMSSNLPEPRFQEKLDELQAARSYLHDFIEYMAFKN